MFIQERKKKKKRTEKNFAINYWRTKFTIITITSTAVF